MNPGSVHVQRSPTGQLLVVAPWHLGFDLGIRRLGGIHHHGEGVWEVFGERESAVHNLINAVYGLQNMCRRCAYRMRCSACPQKLLTRHVAVRVETEMTPQQAASLLDIPASSPATEVRRAFAKKALQSHPDTGGTDAAMRKAVTARDILLNKRASKKAG